MIEPEGWVAISPGDGHLCQALLVVCQELSTQKGQSLVFLSAPLSARQQDSLAKVALQFLPLPVIWVISYLSFFPCLYP